MIKRYLDRQLFRELKLRLVLLCSKLRVAKLCSGLRHSDKIDTRVAATVNLRPKLVVIYRITSMDARQSAWTLGGGQQRLAVRTRSSAAYRPMPSSLSCFMPIADKVIQGQDDRGGSHVMRLSDAQPFSHRVRRSTHGATKVGRTQLIAYQTSFWNIIFRPVPTRLQRPEGIRWAGGGQRGVRRRAAAMKRWRRAAWGPSLSASTNLSPTRVDWPLTSVTGETTNEEPTRAEATWWIASSACAHQSASVYTLARGFASHLINITSFDFLRESFDGNKMRSLTMYLPPTMHMPGLKLLVNTVSLCWRHGAT